MTMECLNKYVQDLDKRSTTDLDIPHRSDGSEYTISDLADDQKKALAAVVGSIKKYCTFQSSAVMRLTVAGVAGSGKSTWINTLVTLVRRLFDWNRSIGVFGPTGSAAFNAGGETINRGLKVPIEIKDLDIKVNTVTYLSEKCSRMICLVIDERSLLEANKFGCAEYLMAQCAHRGKNPTMSWGGIPVVILVGDDYQIPAIGYGAIYSLEIFEQKGHMIPNNAELRCRVSGFNEFKEFGKNVVYLSPDAKRVNKDQDQLKRILKGLRCEDVNQELSEEDVQRLLGLDINHPSFTKKQREEIEETSLYLFACKEPRDALNAKMLLKANLQGNPVAKIRSKTIDRNHGREVTRSWHFDNDRTPNILQICKTAKVGLSGCNIAPAVGLYHGALGVVEDIVYEGTKSPNLGDMPAYVLVNFSQYCGEELIPGRKTSVPIVPTTTICKYGCCIRTFIPLTLAYGKTVHTFQGQSVGPVPVGRPQNSVQRIIVEPGNRQFEANNVGLLYTTVSRPTTIGTVDDKMSSAIYFDGPDFSRQRITNLTKDKSGKLYLKARLRQKWVDYLKENSKLWNDCSMEEMGDLFAWISEQRYTTDELDKIIEKNGSTENVAKNL